MKSEKWTKRKSQLLRKEESIKDELNLAGDEFMTQAKKVSISTLGVGATVLAGYMTYRFFFKEEKDEEIEQLKKEKAELKGKNKALEGMKKAFTERMLAQAVSYAGDRLINYLDKMGIDSSAKKPTKH